MLLHKQKEDEKVLNDKGRGDWRSLKVITNFILLQCLLNSLPQYHSFNLPYGNHTLKMRLSWRQLQGQSFVIVFSTPTVGLYFSTHGRTQRNLCRRGSDGRTYTWVLDTGRSKSHSDLRQYWVPVSGHIGSYRRNNLL